ncbi:MAG: hypothetical protein JW940_15980 [Polyangiaceae bacterium]|nr:hypothetical protein [Polyangiaceae bacterium]
MLISRRALALLALTTLAACSATDSYVPAGGAGGGGSGQGATSFGGSASGGASVTPGGGGPNGGTTPTGSGGSASDTGGTTATQTGGVSGGGPGTGGSVPTGGAAPTGGTATGGVATGGVPTGGVPGTGGVGGIDALTPTENEVCGKDEKLNAQGYIVMSNMWNPNASGEICVLPYSDPGRTYSGFKITSCSVNSSDNSPAAYPAMVAGWHYTFKMAGHGLPKKVNEATSIPATWNYKAPTGKHNVSFDIWLHPEASVSNPGGGMEFMIWVGNSGGVQPFGSQSGNASLAGGSWEIWTGNVSSDGNTWKYVAYKRTSNLGSFEDLDILPLLKDAVSKGHLDGSWNILGIEAGFEIWSGGCTGAETKYYTVMVN